MVFKLKIFNKKIKFCFCHHLPERSIKFFGIEKYLCARCFGMTLGAVIGIILFYLNWKFNLFVLILLIIPLIFDGLSQMFLDRKSNNLLRLITGILFGIGIVLFGGIYVVTI
ncbi:MAG: DUF2085 domain-containing protein [Candidatus ainarchaeum sp.]|nr:DUF2085 domain-containing protein [Candidatus ainarchaeum sp.]